MADGTFEKEHKTVQKCTTDNTVTDKCLTH